MKYPYKYETHLHTCEASACGRAHGADYIAFYKKLGYTGIFVTDHFFFGNSAIDRSLPWPEWVEGYCSGYEAAYEEGQKQGFDVFFGIEYAFKGDEYLIYGVDKQWLLDNPDILSWDHRRLFEEVHKAGGAMVQAHPYRVRGYIEKIFLHPEHVDGAEVFNQGNDQECDALAFEYAKEHDLYMTSGSDIHGLPGGNNFCYGVAFAEPLKSSKDYANAIREGRDHALIAEYGREVVDPEYVADRPTSIYDYQNTETVLRA